MALKSLPIGNYKTARGQLVARILTGSLAGHAFPLGDTECKRTISTEFAERYTNEFATQTLAFKEVDKVTAELEITAYQAGLVAKMVGHMSEVQLVDEPAAADQTEILEDARGDEVIILPARRVSNVVVSDGAASVYVEGEHYTITTGEHGRSAVSLISKPAGAGADVHVDYDRLHSKGDRYGFGSQTEVLCEVIFLEDIKDAPGRTAETHRYPRVGLKVDGDYQMVGADNTPRTITLKGTIYPDTTQPDAYKLGWIEDNVVEAA